MAVLHTVRTEAVLKKWTFGRGVITVAMIVAASIALFAPQASAGIVREEPATPAPLSPQERARLDLDSEIRLRCMLFHESVYLIDLRTMWIAVLSHTVIVYSLPDADRKERSDGLKSIMRLSLQETQRYALDTAVLQELAERPYKTFDYPRVVFEIERILVALEVITTRVLDYTDENDRRLQTENPAALMARIPDDCSRFIEPP